MFLTWTLFIKATTSVISLSASLNFTAASLTITFLSNSIWMCPVLVFLTPVAPPSEDYPLVNFYPLPTFFNVDASFLLLLLGTPFSLILSFPLFPRRNPEAMYPWGALLSHLHLSAAIHPSASSLYSLAIHLSNLSCSRLCVRGFLLPGPL